MCVSVRLDYQLHEARPGLTPEPTALEIGVQQTKSASGKLTLTNKGYSAAQGVQVQLQTREGAAPPAWVRLASSGAIGALDVGQSTLIQVDASPGADVADGYHQLQLKISADNDPGGSVPVTIAVARDGQGGVRFKLVDIYTGTLDAQGQPIAGLANARIVLQNEALTADIRSINSNQAGIAEYTAIPPGNYRWRASAPGHLDASGRITVHAGLTANERVFLDYQLVSIEFSVTKTTIRDEYNIVLEATYQTMVPAPVVLLEPMSISLPAMQQGEEITGELTLSNYGLVRADNLKYALPASDEHFRYEFFGQLPSQLAAKSRVVIPYRITSLKVLDKGLRLNTQPASALERLGAGGQLSAQMERTRRADCASKLSCCTAGISAVAPGAAPSAPVPGPAPYCVAAQRGGGLARPVFRAAPRLRRPAFRQSRPAPSRGSAPWRGAGRRGRWRPVGGRRPGPARPGPGGGRFPTPGPSRGRAGRRIRGPARSAPWRGSGRPGGAAGRVRRRCRAGQAGLRAA